MEYLGYVLVIIFVGVFVTLLFAGRDRREYVVYLADGRIRHLYRSFRDKLFDAFGEKVFYKANGEPVNIGKYWVSIERLKAGEWQKIAEKLSEDKIIDEEASPQEKKK